MAPRGKKYPPPLPLRVITQIVKLLLVPTIYPGLSENSQHKEMEKLAPPFNDETARAKVQRAEDLWNTKDPIKVAQAYTPDCQWRNRDIFLTGRDAIVEFLASKWALERQYKLRKRLFCHDGANKLAVEFEYEFVDEGGQWWRAYGIEHWTFNNDGIMERRDMSANNVAIHESERRI